MSLYYSIYRSMNVTISVNASARHKGGQRRRCFSHFCADSDPDIAECAARSFRTGTSASSCESTLICAFWVYSGTVDSGVKLFAS